MMRPGRAWMPWIAGYASTLAGIFAEASLPAALAAGTLSAVFIGLVGLAQVVWGPAYILRQGRRRAEAGLAIQAAALMTIAFEALPALSPAHSPSPAITGLRVLAGLIALLAIFAPSPEVRRSTAESGSPTALRSLLSLLAGGLLASLLWVAGARMTLPQVIVRLPPGAPTLTPTPHAESHPETGTSHQATFRVRLTRQRAGPYVVDAFTGPTEVGDLFVEVRVADESGRPIEGLAVAVEARPGSGQGEPVLGLAAPDLAEIPGDYAVSLPVSSTGFWDVVVRIGNPPDAVEVAFSERIGGTANVAGWVLAGVPLAIAVLFGLVYLRTAGQRRG